MPAFIFPLARLVEERSPREGLVQVYHNNTWGWVCADQWDKHDADVACRMMYFDGSLSAFSNKFGPTKPVVWINKMQCTGNESSLFSCEHGALGTHDCKDKAGVVCRPKGKIKAESHLAITTKKKTLRNISYFISHKGTVNTRLSVCLHAVQITLRWFKPSMEKQKPS